MKSQKNIKKFASLVLGLTTFAFTFSFGNYYFFLPDAFLTLLTVESESTAYQSINTIRTLQGQYASKHQGNFAPNFDELIKSVQLDEKFAGKNPIVGNYIYKMTVQNPSGTQSSFYSVTADPVDNPNSYFRETYHFYFDSTLKTIKFTTENRPANAADSPI